MKGYEILLETLRKFEVEYVFGIPAGEALDLAWSRMEEFGIKPILVRNEASCGAMADGYAQVSRKPGVCLFGQIGAMFAAPGILEAYHASIPVIGITQTGGSRMYYKAYDHREWGYVNMPPLFDEMTKWTAQIDRVDKVHLLTKRAFRVATTGRPGPVILIFHDEELFKDVDAEVTKEDYVRYPALRMAANVGSIKKAADLLVKAKKPVIYVGNGAIVSQAENELAELAELLDAPVATTVSAKGAIPDAHPLSIGVAGLRCAYPKLRGQVANSFVKEADLALLIGTKMGWITEYDFTGTDTKLIQIDVDPAEIGKRFPVDAAIAGDAKLSLQALLEVLKTRISKKLKELSIAKEIRKRKEEWLNAASVDMNSESAPIKTARIMKELQAFVDKNTLIVLGASTSGIYGCSHLDALIGGRTFVQARGVAQLGLTVPMALGVKLAAPEKRVFCVDGDGSFGYSIGELETAVRSKINVVTIVLNNLCWGWEKRGLEDHFNKTTSTLENSPSADYAGVMEALGGYGILVERPADIKDAIASAIEANKPAVLDIRTDYKDSPGGAPPGLKWSP